MLYLYFDSVKLKGNKNNNMSKLKAFVMAESPEEYKVGVERCVKDAPDFLQVYLPVWVCGELRPDDLENGNILIDCRRNSVIAQEYGIEFDII